MIVKVIIMALLINFSMFFTQVVIDTSNILALVFYNKLDVNTKNPDESTRIYTALTGENEKDLSGAMVKAFNPTSQLTWENFFEGARTPPVGGTGTEEKGTCWRFGIQIKFASGFMTRGECATYNFSTFRSVEVDPAGNLQQVPPGIMLGLILVTGAIMLFAAYAFFIAGISFLGRLIELWILIIFSPFAFMSSTVPKLAGTEYLGWDAWFKRLIATSFMAPIFMFFMYLIFMLINAELFGNLIVENKSMLNTMLLLIIPAMVILLLLMKATKFAKEGGGQFAEMAMTGMKIAGGLALGAATGGAALAGTAIIGGAGGALAGKVAGFAEKKGFGRTATGLRDLKSFAQKSSFDVRNAPGVGALAKAGGLNLGKATEGGHEKRRTDQVKKRQARAEQLKVGEDEKISQNINKAEMDLQVLLNNVAGDFHTIDEELKDLRQKKSDATTIADKQVFTDKIKVLTDAKSSVKSGTSVTLPPGVLGKDERTIIAPTLTRNDKIQTIKSLGNSNDGLITTLKREKEKESRARTVAFANRIGRRGGAANKEAQHKIIMESKIENKEDHK